MSTTANANETATMLLHQRLVLQAGIDYTLLTPLLKKASLPGHFKLVLFGEIVDYRNIKQL